MTSYDHRTDGSVFVNGRYVGYAHLDSLGRYHVAPGVWFSSLETATKFLRSAA